VHPKIRVSWYDYGFRYYDPQIGRFTTSDPMAFKYSALSPYCYVANNPIKAIDPDGREIVIVGGNQEQVYNDLAIIYATPMGRQIIDALQKSSQVYKIDGSAWFATNSRYNENRNKLTYYQGDAKNIDGTSFRSYDILGHELYHAYQDENNQIEGYLRLGIEKGAVKFENYMREFYKEGAGSQRLKYSGNNLFEVNESTSYNTNGQKGDVKSVKTYVEINMGMGEMQQKGDDQESVAKKDNTKNQINVQQLVQRVFQYMEDNKLQKVRIDF